MLKFVQEKREKKITEDKKAADAMVERLKLERPLYATENGIIGVPDAYDSTKLFKAGDPKRLLPNYVENHAQQEFGAIQLNKDRKFFMEIIAELPKNIEANKSTFTTFGK